MSCLWTSEVWSVKGEQQQNYRTIDQGVTSDGLSPNAHRRPSNSQLFPYKAVWTCSGLFWLIGSDAVIKLSGAGRLAVNWVQRPTMYRRVALESAALPF
jgi:hypothetical protein